jgi:hypothetical protein
MTPVYSICYILCQLSSTFPERNSPEGNKKSLISIFFNHEKKLILDKSNF